MSLGLNCCGGRARLRYSPGPEYLMGTGIKSGNERRVVCMVYGLRAKVVAISGGIIFPPINTVSMYLWRYLFRDRFLTGFRRELESLASFRKGIDKKLFLISLDKTVYYALYGASILELDQHEEKKTSNFN